MQQSHCNPDTLDRAWKPPTQPRQPKLLDQLRGALIYTHVLNRGPTGLRSPRMDVLVTEPPTQVGGQSSPALAGGVLIGVPSEDITPMRAKRRDKNAHLVQHVGFAPIGLEPSPHSRACYVALQPCLGC
jgi:hypothetical protein